LRIISVEKFLFFFFLFRNFAPMLREKLCRLDVVGDAALGAYFYVPREKSGPMLDAWFFGIFVLGAQIFGAPRA
jgi:hypothetical protein